MLRPSIRMMLVIELLYALGIDRLSAGIDLSDRVLLSYFSPSYSNCYFMALSWFCMEISCDRFNVQVFSSALEDAKSSTVPFLVGIEDWSVTRHLKLSTASLRTAMLSYDMGLNLRSASL